MEGNKKYELSFLRGKTIQAVYYFAENGGTGIFEKDKGFHLVEDGSIIFRMSDDTLLELYEDYYSNLSINKASIKINKIEYHEIKSDFLWSKLSSKEIFDFKIHKDSLYITSGKEQVEERVISTIVLIFLNGERIYLSNAGYWKENQIKSLTGSLLIYSKRKIGVDLGLIK